MRLSLSSFAIAAAAITSVVFVVGAVYVTVFYKPVREIDLQQVLAEAQLQSEVRAAISRTTQVYLIGEGRLSYANQEMTFETFATRVELESWDDHTSVQVLIASPNVGEDNVRLLNLLARRGVFHVRILPPASTPSGQP
jgi:hypothetical protein